MTDVPPASSDFEPRSFAPEQAAAPAAEDALSVLSHDHRTVERLLGEYREAADELEKVTIAERLCLALTIHAQIEEELFYPALRNAVGAREQVDEAVVEHMAAKQMIADVESASVDDPLFDAKVRVLAETALRHASDEEEALFALAAQSGVDLVELGRRLRLRKAELCREAALSMKSRLRASGGPATQMAGEHASPSSHAMPGPFRAMGAAADLALAVLPGGGRLRRFVNPNP
ncbi:MAG TPA: hemerythrin domain-containing protein [Caulobacteraceae bacterium]|nr:hemerythrin domain-containing protein [Caulobacteraceae bacterium]